MNRDDFGPGPLAATHAIADGDRWTVVFVRHLPHPPAAVWDALTEADQIAAWAPFTADRDLARPGPATLTLMDGDDAADSNPAEVTQCEPPSLLEYTWGPDLLRWVGWACGFVHPSRDWERIGLGGLSQAAMASPRVRLGVSLAGGVGTPCAAWLSAVARWCRGCCLVFRRRMAAPAPRSM